MTLSPKILTAIKKVEAAHAALFAALEKEARRKRPGRSTRRRAGPPGQGIKGDAEPTSHPEPMNGRPASKVL